VSVADTSIQAYQNKIENGEIETDKERCFMIIKRYGPITSKEMERHMGKSKYSFSGRINELKSEDVVEVTGTKDGHQLLNTIEQSEVDREWVSSTEDVELDLEDEDEGKPSLFIDDNKKESEAGEIIWS